MTCLGTILFPSARRLSARPTHDLDRFSLTPAGEAALEALEAERAAPDAETHPCPHCPALAPGPAYSGPCEACQDAIFREEREDAYAAEREAEEEGREADRLGYGWGRVGHPAWER